MRLILQQLWKLEFVCQFLGCDLYTGATYTQANMVLFVNACAASRHVSVLVGEFSVLMCGVCVRVCVC